MSFEFLKYKLGIIGETGENHIKKWLTWPEPFITQHYVLSKYNIHFAGVCRAMTNLYVYSKLNGEDPSKYLMSDAKFLTHVLRENREEQAKMEQGTDEDELPGYPFQKMGLPFKQMRLSPKDLTTEKINQLVKRYKHINIAFPVGYDELNNEILHQVYVGQNVPEKAQSAVNECSSFDANKIGGESSGECSKVISHSLKMINRYLLAEQTPNIHAYMPEPDNKTNNAFNK